MRYKEQSAESKCKFTFTYQPSWLYASIIATALFIKAPFIFLLREEPVDYTNITALLECLILNNFRIAI